MIEMFVDKVKEILKEKLVSIVAYGSFVKGNYKPGKSDINIIVIAENYDVSDLTKIKEGLLRIINKKLIKPLFFTPYFLKSSSDVFPVEWKEIKESYRILYGKDLINEIDVKREDLRIQLEKEIKQNYLNFQQGIAFGRDLNFLIRDSFKSLKVFLRNMRELFKKEIQEPAYFVRLNSVFEKNKRISRLELDEYAKKHLQYLEELTKLTDQQLV